MDHNKLQAYLWVPCKLVSDHHNPVCVALRKAKKTAADLKPVRDGIAVLLTNFDEDSAAGRHFTKAERTSIATVRKWLKHQATR